MADSLLEAFYKKGQVILARPLGTRVSLGSVGYFDKGQWIEVSNTEAMFGLKLKIDAGSTQPNSFNAKEGKKLKFEAKAAGEPAGIPNVVEAKARVEISFGSEGAFVMNVKNQSVSTAGMLNDLMIAIRKAYRDRTWEKKYAVIVGLASADSVTALLSSTRNATAVVTGGATSAGTTLGQLDANMTVTASKESVEDLWRAPAEGYAFRALRIDPGMFTKWDKEDIKFVDPRAIRRGARPAAEIVAFDPGTVKVEELTPSGGRAVKLSAFASQGGTRGPRKRAMKKRG